MSDEIIQGIAGIALILSLIFTLAFTILYFTDAIIISWNTKGSIFDAINFSLNSNKNEKTTMVWDKPVMRNSELVKQAYNLNKNAGGYN